jgi:hypothetical protein
MQRHPDFAGDVFVIGFAGLPEAREPEAGDEGTCGQSLDGLNQAL